jgi:ribonucleotide monophosphatase NagD (HAD superfamily)
MVGDNPRADIKGANTAGWASFLTQTGIHHGK